MAPSSASRPPIPSATVRYGRDDFQQAVGHVSDEATNGHPVTLLFAGGAKADRQQALSELVAYAGLSQVQRDLAGLIGDRPRQTQAYLREAFDNVSDDPMLLYFDNADTLYEAVARQVAEEDLDADALTPLDYFYQRAQRLRGIVVVVLNDPAHLDRARAFPHHLIVEF